MLDWEVTLKLSDIISAIIAYCIVAFIAKWLSASIKHSKEERYHHSGERNVQNNNERP